MARSTIASRFPRLQLFEFLDQPWCPGAVRRGATDFLEAIISWSNSYRSVQRSFFDAIARSGASRVVDLCAGGGGPWLSPSWRNALSQHPPLRVLLTDKFPDRALCERLRADPLFDGMDDPVDATSVPASLSGFRTVFSSFHHFADPMAREVLANAVQSREGFAMAEVTARRIRALAIIFLLPWAVWLLTPRMRPFRWWRLVLTYLVPAIPFVVFWDGIVSCFRTRTPEELLDLVRDFPEYDWKAGYGSGVWLPPVYLIGLPRLLSTPK